MIFYVPLLAVLAINSVVNSIAIHYLLAAAPILGVLILMTVFRMGGQYAGLIGLVTGIFISTLAFGLSPEVLWISQFKGLLLSLFVIAVFLPALFLYNIVNQANGIQAVARALESWITDRGLLLIVVAWAFSGMLEGLAGFGLPVAIVSPMLVGLGVDPILAVTSVAVGHAWAVTFGDMGVVLQTLTALVQEDPATVARYTAILLGIASLFCGLAVANIFKRLDRWFAVIALSGVMGTVQYLCTVYRLPALAGFLAGASGVAGAMLINRFLLSPVGASRLADSPSLKLSPPLVSALVSYGSLALIMAAINLIPPLRQELAKLVWSVSFPQVETLNGFMTAAKHNQTYQPLLHPGASIILVSSFSFWLNKKSGLYQSTDLRKILTLTLKSALPAMMGIISMVGLSSLMDHTGMNLLLAQLLSSVFYGVFPLVSPLIGMLGAFATGSNNNSNVLFASMQEGIALILKLSPGIIIAAQTTGGSLGSMIAPAKIIVGLSTVNQPDRDGDVLRQTLPYGLIIGLIMGVITLILTSFF